MANGIDNTADNREHEESTEETAKKATFSLAKMLGLALIAAIIVLAISFFAGLGDDEDETAEDGNDVPGIVDVSGGLGLTS